MSSLQQAGEKKKFYLGMVSKSLMNGQLKAMSDEKLLELFVLKDNQQAFSTLYKRYFKLIAKYIGWMANDMDTGKDVVQNVFSKLYTNPESFDLNKKFKPWIYVVAKNKLNNEWRDVEKRNRIVNEYVFLNDVINEEEEEGRKKQKISKALKQLSDEHRTVFVLKYSSNLTIREISEVQGCSIGTVKSRLFYAMKHVKEIVNI